MPLTQYELEHLSEDILADRIITHSLYCANCGYNLRLLPYMGLCPECGSQYNARPLSMEGIFLPQNLEVPLADLVVFAVSGLTSAGFLIHSLKPFASGFAFIGIVTGVISLSFAVRVWGKLKVMWKFRGVARRIQSGEYN